MKEALDNCVDDRAEVAEPDLLTVEQIAIKLQRSVSTIYYFTSRGEIPFEKHGRSLRFDYEKVREHFRQKSEEARKVCQVIPIQVEPRPRKRSLTSRTVGCVDSRKKE